MRIMVSGGAGFIGSAVCRHLVRDKHCDVLNVDKLTYAGNTDSLRGIEDSRLYRFVRADICDRVALDKCFQEFQPDAVMHLAAESHVDRSIDGPAEFISTNIIGTYTMLESARAYWLSLGSERKESFRFQHISTDEVYGSLGPEGEFTENTAYDPHSPYSASKASSDHLVMAWHHTYGLPVLLTNCSNNYGPYQFPEKLVPLTILNAIEEKALPIYGTGDNVRDWLYVGDHARALSLIIDKGAAGEKYNVGGHNERTNLEIVEKICAVIDELRPRKNGAAHRELISFVKDRPGHDKRYAIDPRKLETELGWNPSNDFDSGIRKTVQWYLDNQWWWKPIRQKSYAGARLGKCLH